MTDSLIDGYRRFRAHTWDEQRHRFEELARGQSPETLVIACSDSRVDPQMIFDAAPGELFVVRNVAALVPPYEPDKGPHGVSAALEFAVRVLGVKRVVVLGHAQCGGVNALVHGAPDEAQDFVPKWMSLARPAVQRAAERGGGAAGPEAYEEEVVRLGLENLMGFPWVAEAVREGRLAVHGMRFGIEAGVLTRLSESGRFEPVSPEG
jgi:carbonic anhydrase